MTLKNFPRGGKKPDIKPSSLSALSKKTKFKSKKPSKAVSVKEVPSEKNELDSDTAQDLKFTTIVQGMNILGRIFKVTNYDAIISLPGQLHGRLKATDISETYLKLLDSITKDENTAEEFKSLPEMFKQGDYVVCYVKKMDAEEGISLSLEPQLINQNLNPEYLAKNSKVSFAIHSVEDHGYVLETGSSNLRAFLSKKDVENEEITFCPGKQIICSIKSIKFSENNYTAKVSTKLKYLAAVEQNIENLDVLIPGLQVSVVVKKVLKDGLKLKFGENVGFANQIYLAKSPSSYQKKQELVGTLLYTIPTIKFSYFSLLGGDETGGVNVGDIIDKARVISRESKGILIKLKKGVRGFIPLNKTGVKIEKVPTLFLPDSQHRCRVLSFNLMQKLFVCTMEKELLEEKYFDEKSITAGLIEEVTVEKIQNNGAVNVILGRLRGYVPVEHRSDPGDKISLKPKQKIRARVLSVQGGLKFTLKNSLISSKLPILMSRGDATIHSTHDGTVFKIFKAGVAIRYFNNVEGWIPAGLLNRDLADKNWNFVVGQTITTVIKKVDINGRNEIVVAPVNTIIGQAQSRDTGYNIGDMVRCVATDSSVDGVHLRVVKDNMDECSGFLPANHMAPCAQVGGLLAAKTVAGDKFSAVVFATYPGLTLSTTFVPDKVYTFDEIQTGTVIVCSVVKITDNHLEVTLPIKDHRKLGRISIGEAEKVQLNQILHAQVVSINHKTKNLILTAKFAKIWANITHQDAKMTSCVDPLSSYLSKIYELSKNIYFRSKPIALTRIGQEVQGHVTSVLDNFLVIELDDSKVQGLVHREHASGKEYSPGDKVVGKVLWVNYTQDYVGMTLHKSYFNAVSSDQSKVDKIPDDVQLRGVILLVTDWFVLAVLKGEASGTLVALPVRRHLNDIEPDISPYKVGAKIKCYNVLQKDEANTLVPICILKSFFEKPAQQVESQEKMAMKRKMKMEEQKIKAKKKKLDKKQKKKQEENNEQKKSTPASDVEESESEDDPTAEPIPETSLNVGWCWDNKPKVASASESSSDSEEDQAETDSASKKQKKKKLSASERRELEREKERELRQKEEALAGNQIPQSADQFDRLVLASPDSSLVWIEYMAHHLQSAEVEKARMVAKRATKTINFREEDERLNVWQAWLNLESKFGTPETLNEVFQEAIRVNDAEKIFAHMLTVYVEAGKQAELEKTINTMIAKFKQNPETWIKCGNAYLGLGLKDKSRHIMQRALQSLPPTKHVDLMVRFAQMENKFGDKERSQTLFEQILSSYPKRTDVWSSYVDSLVKYNDIDLARKVLDRAISQNLPAKKMKTLFKKYINFEEKHGKPTNVTRIQELAVKYVEEHTTDA